MKKNKSKNKKTTASNIKKSIEKTEKTYYSIKKIMKFCGIFAAVFGLSFGGSFFTKPDSSLSRLGYEIYDIVYEIFADFDNLEYGAPGKADRIINREGYAIGYSNQFKQPLWVCYNLTAGEAENKNSYRINDFRSDWRLFGKSADPDDYKGSNFDRGHLAPAADMAWSTKTMSQSFFMSNMSPQHPSFNRGIWKELEEQVRKWAVKFKKIHVISGPVFINPNRKFIGNSRVGVPEYYYKIIYAPEQVQMIGFLMPNKDINGKLGKYAVPVYDIEDAVQFEFFMKLAPDVRRKLKMKADKDFWGI